MFSRWESHILIAKVKGLLCLLLGVFGIFFMIRAHDQALLQIQQVRQERKDAWGASIMESMPDMDSIKTQETVHYYMDVRQLDDGNKEVRIRNKDLEPPFLRNVTRYYIVFKDFSYVQVQGQDSEEIRKRFSKLEHK